MKKLIYLLLILIIVSIAFFVGRKVYAPEEKIQVISLEQEKVSVDKYIRDNIKILATDSTVLGGSWYVISIEITPKNKSGFVTYEDGHIQSKATFSYSIENKEIKISNWKIE